MQAFQVSEEITENWAENSHLKLLLIPCILFIISNTSTALAATPVPIQNVFCLFS